MISVVGFLSMSATISLTLRKNTFPSANSIPDIETRNDFHLHFVCTYTMDIIYFLEPYDRPDIFQVQS